MADRGVSDAGGSLAVPGQAEKNEAADRNDDGGRQSEVGKRHLHGAAGGGCKHHSSRGLPRVESARMHIYVMPTGRLLKRFQDKLYPELVLD